MPRSARFLIPLAVVVLAAGAGFRLAGALAPEHLHERVESWLEEATKADAELTDLRVVFGFPIRLEGTGLSLYDGALQVESASARFDVVSLLLGRPRLTRLRLDGAHLELERSPEGVWKPPIFRKSDRDEVEPALEPLRAIDIATRFLLTKPLLADTLVVTRSRVSVVHADPSGSGRPVRVVFESVNGRLLHSRLFGDARLFLRVRLRQNDEERGRLEWNGTRGEDGAMHVTMAATSLDLSTLATYVRGARPTATLRGTLDGVGDFTTSKPGEGRLDLDLAARDFRTSVAPEPAGDTLRLPSLSLRMRVDLDAERVVLSRARIGTGEFDFSLDATIARPLRDASSASMTVSLAELPMAPETARRLAGWLPASGRERFVSLAERVRSGRLVRAGLRGRARVRRWRELFAGRLDQLPKGLRFTLEIDDVTIDVDEANRLERLNASLAYENDKLEVRDASGDLNGGPLPSVDLSFQGLSKLLDAPPQEGEMASSAEALVGLTPLFDFLRGDPREDRLDTPDPPSVVLNFEHVHHPALLWPMHDVRVQVTLERDADGVRMQLERCAWAGVRLDGEVDWTLRPDRRLAIDLVASADPEEAVPEPAAPEPEVALATAGVGPGPWILGRFEVGRLDSPSWSQRGAKGSFSAAGGELRLEQVEIELEPTGLLTGSVDLDLTKPDTVPYTGQLNLDRGDVKTLIRQRGVESEVMSGNLGLRARIAGTLVPGRSLLHDADGEAELRAVEGAIQRSVPPVLALALASNSLNPFSRREELRYDRAGAHFALEGGVVRTENLEIEGPDIRLFASGTLDLTQKPRALDAEVVLFLFRQVDRALELIPILNVLLLGANENLVAAYFELVGTWEDPVARAKPLRTLEEGPGDVLTKGIPRVITRGVKAIGGLFGAGASEEEPAESDAVEPPAEVAPTDAHPSPAEVAPSDAHPSPADVAPSDAHASPAVVAPSEPNVAPAEQTGS